jgi:ABC-type transport system involved in multi-copper enzyme maturation permease subunit
MRVVSDIGAASISIYAIIVAVVLGATSLYRELELKTIFPILARPIRRSEYLVGKLLGTVLTLAVFVAANTGVLLLALAVLADGSIPATLGVGVGGVAVLTLIGLRFARVRTYLPLVWALGVAVAGYFLAAGAPDDRRVVAGLACLTLFEVTVIAALATLFSSFSSPFLTAVFTFSVVIVGRSADSLAKLPSRVFGETIHQIGEFLSRIVPNLMLFVPPRPLLTGEASGADLPNYLLLAGAHALGWSVLLVALGSVVFQRRDFL